MKNVYLDHELINFEGPEISDLDQLALLISRHLASQGRCIERFLVDGQVYVFDEAMPESYERIDIFSVDLRGYYELRVKEQLNNEVFLGDFFKDVAGKILSEPWEQGFSYAEDVVKKMKPFVALIEELSVYPEQCDWKESLVDVVLKFKEVFNLYTSAMAFRDVGCVAEILIDQMQPLVQESMDSISGPILAYLQGVNPEYDFTA